MHTPEWLKNAIFYEIYPQSFCDSNGDGIGDLQGIISKLDYVKSLNVSAIWLNPCFDSTFLDAGYDVSDYRKIAPRYGSNEDMRQLIGECHKRGLKLLLDLVAGHTSMQHPWFRESQKGPANPYSNYYVWTNGWREPTGNYRFISGLSTRDGYFMINFFACQPKLNYGFCPPDPEFPWQLGTDHPDVVKVREELRGVMKFWLDMGCDGFRVDLAGSLVCGADRERGNRELWNDYRNWMEKHYPDAVLVAEWGEPAKSIPAGFHVDFMIHCYDPGYTGLFRVEPERIGEAPHFSRQFKHSFFDQSGEGDVTPFLNALSKNLQAIRGKGFCGLVSGNHDLGRIGTGRSAEALKGAYTFLFLLPGIPFLYYGDEVGMKNVYGLGNVEGSYDRSAARTPMQWQPGAGAGFSSAPENQFYLPLDPAWGRPNATEQEQDPESLLNYVRFLFQLRQSDPVLANEGEFKILYAQKEDPVVIYERSGGEGGYVIAVNASGRAASAVFTGIEADQLEPVKRSSGIELKTDSGATCIDLPANGYAIYRK